MVKKSSDFTLDLVQWVTSELQKDDSKFRQQTSSEDINPQTAVAKNKENKNPVEFDGEPDKNAVIEQKDMEQNNDVEDQYFAGEIIKKQGGQLPNHEGGNNYQNFVNKNTGGSIIFDNLSEKPNQSGGEDIKNVTVSFF